MNILFDECMPRTLRRYLQGHVICTVTEMGWAGIKNGELIKLAETQFDVRITVDKSMKHQQKLESALMGFVVLRAYSNTVNHLKPFASEIIQAIEIAMPGDVIIVDTRT
jgi:predicted nuclease of predicted toxin-antitoxin system